MRLKDNLPARTQRAIVFLTRSMGESQLTRSLFPMVAKAAEFFRTRDNFLCVSAA